MIRLLLAFVVSIGVIASLPALAAGTQPAAPAITAEPPAAPAGRAMTPAEVAALHNARNELALYHYGSRYMMDMVLGIVGGGIAGALMPGGPVATITGSVAGALVGIWWFFDQNGDQLLAPPAGP